MTPQEIFDRVGVHLLTQNEASGVYDEYSALSCRYRGPKALKCAIGVLIPDANYSDRFEGCKADHKTVITALGFEVTQDTADLLVGLQNIHDVYPPIMWYQLLCDLAACRGLSAKAIKTLNNS